MNVKGKPSFCDANLAASMCFADVSDPAHMPAGQVVMPPWATSPHMITMISSC